jgi:hypothetical protein
MRKRIVGENQDESKRPFKRRRTRRGTLRKPATSHQRHYSQSLTYGQHTRITHPTFEEDTSLLKARRRRAKPTVTRGPTIR